MDLTLEKNLPMSEGACVCVCVYIYLKKKTNMT